MSPVNRMFDHFNWLRVSENLAFPFEIPGPNIETLCFWRRLNFEHVLSSLSYLGFCLLFGGVLGISMEFPNNFSHCSKRAQISTKES